MAVSPWAKGFTLIEVMVTLTILGFIMLMIFGVFRLGLASWEKGDATKEEYQKVRAATQMITRQLKSTVPYRVRGTTKLEGDTLAFEGRPRLLKFVSALPLKARQYGLVYVIYELREGGVLAFYEQRVLNRNFMEEMPRPESGAVLLDEIADLRFEYLREENAEKNQEAVWLEEWNAREEKALPRALRLTLIPQKGKGRPEGAALTILASLPSHTPEEINLGPVRRAVPQGPGGTNLPAAPAFPRRPGPATAPQSPEALAR